ncbi:MAG: hypothetical protein P4L51_06290 [Puia sp.]|nr:hypothetical protein [Puia sp.]
MSYSAISTPGRLSPAEARIAATMTAQEKGFLQFIWTEKANRLYLIIALVGSIVQFSIFKLFYPFADFFSDSYSYIYAAYAHLDVSIWPIGYSKFLAAFHALTYSDTALVAFQYFFLELTALYLFLTILYFYRPSRPTKIILFTFLFLNPLFLYFSNYVNSDPLFAALSFWWFSELILIVNRPRIHHVLTQGIPLFLCFTVRNNAYYYPLITIVAYLLSRQPRFFKLAGILAGPLLILPFIIHTRQLAKQMTGTAQYSLFTGWQLANNALYIYQYADTNTALSGDVKIIDQLSKQFFAQVPKDFQKNILSRSVGNLFIRYSGSPLKQFYTKHYKFTDEYGSIVAWGKASVVFSDFGSYIIGHNPNAYVWEFILPNIKNYMMPPLEKLAQYNVGYEDVSPIAKYWFRYRPNKLSATSNDIQWPILFVFPMLFFALNIYLLFCLGRMYINHKNAVQNPRIRKLLQLACCALLLNFLFSVSVTINVFRYQFFPIIILLITAMLLMEWQGKSVRENNTIENDNSSQLKPNLSIQ